ncbi:ribonuclease P/MRP protein subunit POP5-like [Montipora foliosa]|uniref:ribonuclease P/MRP protein subunit POP5-like n=1 Tax=Montipora foliosa TaxID=591990 RepID=UPI0035F13DB8
MVRFKRRYLLVEISFQDKKVDEDLTSTCLYQKIIQAIQECHGDYGVACTWLLKVKYVNPVTGVAFIACHRDYYRMVWSAMTFIKKLKQRLCMWRVLHIGGTLRSCQRFLIRYNKDQLLQALQQCKTPAERKRVLRTIKKAEKFEIPLDPLETKKRKASTKGSYNNND